MNLWFTQYIPPNGRTERLFIPIEDDSDTFTKATHLINAKCHFDIEILSTGVVSMTCEIDDAEGGRLVLSHELVENNKEVVTAVNRLVESAWLALPSE